MTQNLVIAAAGLAAWFMSAVYGAALYKYIDGKLMLITVRVLFFVSILTTCLALSLARRMW